MAGREIFVLSPESSTAKDAVSHLETLGCRVAGGAERGAVGLCFYDTWNGALRRRGHALVRLDGPGGDWRLTRQGRLVAHEPGVGAAGPSGSVARALTRLIRDPGVIPHIHAVVRDTRWSIRRDGTRAVRATLRQYRFSSPHRPGLEAERMVLVLEDDGSAAAGYLASVLRRRASMRSEGTDPIGLGLDALGIEMPRAKQVREVRRGDTQAVAAAHVLRGLHRRLEACWGGAAADLHPEYVHELRVACRTLRHAVGFLRRLIHAEAAVTLTAELRWLSGILAPVRDADVFCGFLAADSDERATPLRGLITDARRRAVRELSDNLRSQRFASLRERVAGEADQVLRCQGGVAEEAVTVAAGRIIRRAVARLDGYRDRDPRGVEDKELHDARSRFRRLRFACELFRTAFGARIDRIIRDIVEFQDCLGHHQDATVAILRLEALSVEATRSGIQDPDAYEFLQTRVRECRRLRDASRERLSSIWPSIRPLTRRIRRYVGPKVPVPGEPASPPAFA